MALKAVGSNPTNYPVNSVTIFSKKKIKKKQFRKKTHLLVKVFQTPQTPTTVLSRVTYRNLNFYKKYLNELNINTTITKKRKILPTIVSISQKKFNPKCTIYKDGKNVNTFSVGSIVKYFKLKQSKYVRRSLKGLKVFLNFLKNLLEKFYLKFNKGCIAFCLSGVDYNLVNLKKNIKTLIKHNCMGGLIFLVNIKVSFTKKRDKKIKAIKKRLKKKLILNFIKTTL